MHPIRLLHRLSQSLFHQTQRLPSLCLLCACSLAGDEASGLCDFCRLSLPRLTRPFCQICALPLPANLHTQSQAQYCGQCLRQRPAFSRALIPFSYNYPLDALLQGFKYQRQLAQGLALGHLLAEHLRRLLLAQPLTQPTNLPQALVPVPMHWRKRWQRGFNQAELLALELSRQLQLPVLDACQHRGAAHSQQGLGRRERLGNLRRAFALKPKTQALVKGKHLALVDDVVTTGATATSLAELLLKAGAASVDIWALARTPAPDA